MVDTTRSDGPAASKKLSPASLSKSVSQPFTSQITPYRFQSDLTAKTNGLNSKLAKLDLLARFPDQEALLVNQIGVHLLRLHGHESFGPNCTNEMGEAKRPPTLSYCHDTRANDIINERVDPAVSTSPEDTIVNPYKKTAFESSAHSSDCEQELFICVIPICFRGRPV
ncbi:hypothetical protein PsorP6_015388 [Peronosclerospora sorghi]|uniref:Uncharacterized protein n=1 Tax=Peronosclerospora sorghi TaxID=230839 RepID=A0ACC0WR23_9STRA|nr:hypothetical protein PsorP6_015388 [Peronosclerospora sorghi]